MLSNQIGITQISLMRFSPLIVVLLGVVLARAPGYPEAPPVAHTGGFGEPTCQQCHFDLPLNDPGGALTLDGVPDDYAAGARYLLTAQLIRPEMRRSGFQVSARFADGARAGQQAGLLQPVNDHVDVVLDDASAIQYAHHTKPGTHLAAPDTARWTLAWTAPEAAGRIVFHLTANAANDDASEFGDYVYSGTWFSSKATRGE